jgi:hypothetical protein
MHALSGCSRLLSTIFAVGRSKIVTLAPLQPLIVLWSGLRLSEECVRLATRRNVTLDRERICNDNMKQTSESMSPLGKGVAHDIPHQRTEAPP